MATLLRYIKTPSVAAVACILGGLTLGLLILHDYATPSGALRGSPVPYAETGTTSASVFSLSGKPGSEVDVPILVYHIVRPAYPDDSAAVRALAHTPEVFDAQMQYLHDAGYQVISFADLENFFLRGSPLPAHPIIISFDDGWRNQFEYAFPLLAKHGYTATFFIFTNAIGRPNFVSWDNLRTLRDAGMTIGSHSRSHPYLTRLHDSAMLWREIAGSKEILEKNLGVVVSQFAYPFGQYDEDIARMVEKAGYQSARGDFYSGKQSVRTLFGLSAINAPTTTPLFQRAFPARSDILTKSVSSAILAASTSAGSREVGSSFYFGY